MIKAVFVVCALLASSQTDTPYSYDAKAEKDDIRKELNLYFAIHPDEGWKWNKKYPAKYKFKHLDNNKGEKLAFKDGIINVVVPWQEKPINEVVVEASFSLCTAAVCKVFRSKSFKIMILKSLNER